MVLLRWWFLLVVQSIGMGFAVSAGFVQKLWEVDVTRLSLLCIATLFLASAFIGWLTWRAEQGRTADLEPHVDVAWFASELMMGLGMVGTVLGFLIMLHDAFSGTMAAQEVMLRAAPGLGTICVTTAVGLICSMCCKAQLVNLGYLIRTP